MAAEVFPAFIRAEYDPSGNAFPAFERAAEGASASVRQRFESDFESIKQTVASALSVPRNSGGSLDLGADQQRELATALQARATAANEVATAMRNAASAAGDDSASARASLAAAEALEIEYRQEAQAALSHAEALEQVQTELNKTASATDAVIAGMNRGTTAYGAVTNSTRAWRFASLQAGQQLQDITVQLAGGQRASLVFAQQLPQLAFAFSGVEGAAGSLAARVGGAARFLSGPWGAAIGIAVFALGPFVAKMFEGGDASEELTKNLQKAATAADSFGNASSMLGKIIDINTGKLKTHNKVLIETVRLQAEAALLTGQEDARKARKSIGHVGDLSLGQIFGIVASGPNDANDAAGRQNSDTAALSSLSANAPLRALSNDILTGTLSNPTAIRQRVDVMAKAGQLASYSAKEIIELKKQLLSLPQALNDQKSAKQVIDAIDGKGVAADLKPYQKPKKERTRKPRDLTRDSESAAELIARINGEWDETPRLIDKANAETLKLDNLIKDLGRSKPPGFEKLIADARQAKIAIVDGLQRPYTEFVKRENEHVAIQHLINTGRQVEAEALQDILHLQRQMGPLTDTQKRNILEMAVARKREADAAELERQRQQAFLGALQQTQQVIAQSISTLRTGGFGAGFKSLTKGLGSTLDNLVGNYVTNKVFGPLFQQLQNEVKSNSPLGRASAAAASNIDDFGAMVAKLTTRVDAVPDATDRVAKSLGRLADALDGASAKISKTPAPANDNAPADSGVTGPDIVVTGRRPLSAVDQILQGVHDPFSLSGETVAKSLASVLRSIGIKLSPESIKTLGDTLGGAIKGAYVGQVAGGLILGKSGNKTGEAIGGALGQVAGKAIGKAIGGIAGQIGGPIGSVVGGVLGGLVGGIFGSKPKGAQSTLQFGQSGITVGQASGTKASQDTASQLAGSVAQGLNTIAQQLGGIFSGQGSVSVGYRPGHKDPAYRVDTTGQGKLTGVQAFADATAAVQYAILDALKDGAIKGISEGAQRLLAAGQDLNTQLQKALSFEQVFKDLKARTDPVGAAIDTVNAKFVQLKAIFKEAGASAEDYANLEKEYQFERADAIKAATQQSLGSLKDLLDRLTTGDNGRSLRDRIAAAKAAYDPLAAQIASGNYQNSDQYSSAASTLLGLERQLSGSQAGYFTLLDQVTAATKGAVDAQQKVIDNATNASTPFSEASGTSAVTGSIDTMSSSLGSQLAAVNDNLGTLINLQRAAPGANITALARLSF